MKRLITAVAFGTLLVAGACANSEETPQSSNKQNASKEPTSSTPFRSPAESDFYKEVSEKKIDHIHGVGYAGGNSLVVASHKGLVAYEEGNWYETKSDKHDYMGFQAVDSGFYASGHPEQGSSLKNPLGIVKSEDGGRSIEKLAFYGETDFHYMTVGYNNHMIYVVNQQPNSKLGTGVYYSDDKGETWKQSKIEGFPQKPVALYAHPETDSKVAIAAQDGIYLSENYGDSFERISEAFPATALAFSSNGGMVAAGIKDENAILYRYNKPGGDPTEVNLPELEKEAIYYVVVNPKSPEIMTIVTEKNNIYTSRDNGENWSPIMENGELKAL